MAVNTCSVASITSVETKIAFVVAAITVDVTVIGFVVTEIIAKLTLLWSLLQCPRSLL